MNTVKNSLIKENKEAETLTFQSLSLLLFENYLRSYY